MLIKGQLLDNATLIKDEVYERKFCFAQTLHDTVRIEVPKDDMKISFINVEDLWRDGTNGTATILSGGINEKSVSLQLMSQFGRGYKCRVKVYTKQIVVFTPPKNTVLLQGKICDDAVLVTNQVYSKEFILLQNVCEDINIQVPKECMKICLLCVEDLWRDGTNGTACIKSGGINESSVSLQLTSQFSRGYKFRVIAYAC